MLLAQIDPNQAHRFLTESNYTAAGILLILTAAIGFGIWRISVWMGAQVLIPARDRAFKHLDAVDMTMREISGSLQKLSEIPVRLDRIEGKVDTLTDRVDNIDEHMKMQDARVKPTRTHNTGA